MIRVLIFLMASSLFARQSLTLTGTTGTLVVPNAAPYTSLADHRIEFRFTNFSTPGTNQTLFVIGTYSGATYEFQFWSSGEICVNNNIDGANRACTDLTGYTDVTIRWERTATTHGLYTYDTTTWTQIPAYCGWKANGGSGYSQCSLGSGAARDLSGSVSFASGVTGRIAWWKWYPSTYGNATGPMGEYGTATLGDFRFEGNLTDTSGNLSITGIGSPAYTTTDNYSPVCSAGSDTTVRAGTTNSLSGSGSFSRGGADITTYMWQRTAGPSNVVWTNQATVSPTYSGTVFGQYTFQLAAGDGTLTSTCTVKIGAVGADSNGVVAQPSTYMTKVFGPQIKWGNNPWPWTDVINLSAADNRIARMETDYPVWWDTPLSGTISLTNGSTAITGTGTAFNTDFCTSDSSKLMVVWWVQPDASIGRWATRVTSCSAAALGGNTGNGSMGSFTLGSGAKRGVYRVTITAAATNGGTFSVTDPDSISLGSGTVGTPFSAGNIGFTLSDGTVDFIVGDAFDITMGDATHATLQFQWEQENQTNVQYSYYSDGLAGLWNYGAAPVNYYDNVMGYYSLYYRTGLEKYRDMARTLADRIYVSPNIDKGYAPSSGFLAWQARSQSLTGLTLRALDGRSDMWPGLRRMYDYNIALMGGDITTVGGVATYIVDAREAGYHLSAVALCALFDPDATHKATCKAALVTHYNNVWSVNPGTATKGGVGSFPMFAYSWASWGSGGGNGGTVNLTNGSSTVQGVGTAWTSTFSYAGATVDVAGVNQPICFASATTLPADNSGFDPVCYTISAINTGTQTITLDRAYEGTTKTGAGWAITFQVPVGTQALIGYGNQPFFSGIIAGGMYYAQLALDEGSYNPTVAAAYRTYIGQIRTWLEAYAWRSSMYGMYYGAGFANCQPPINDALPNCTAGGTEPEARNMNAEGLRAWVHTYQLNPSSGVKDFADVLYTALFSKPGYTSLFPTLGGTYQWYWDNFFNGGVPPAGTAHKWFGMYFGYGNLSSWPAVRIGGYTSNLKTYTVSFSLPAGSDLRRLYLTRPSGEVVTVDCASSPCSITYDAAQGTHRIYWQDRTSGGAVRAESDTITL